MRKPNRKYKVPREVMAERLELGWLNAVRVCALCKAIHGYELEMENWGQTPLHNNESGSKDVLTIAFSGSLVPIVEGHAETRERWTANLTTFSNKERIMKEGPPYAEFMFKGRGGILQRRLQEHLRSRRVGPRASAVTSEKTSHRVDDVLNFLERHLPKMEEGRRWRMMFVDDAKRHLSPMCADSAGVVGMRSCLMAAASRPWFRRFIQASTNLSVASTKRGKAWNRSCRCEAAKPCQCAPQKHA